MARPTEPATLLVLRKTKLGETDLIITGLSEEGTQVRAVAKGARKPGSRLGSSLELYSVTRVLLHQGKNLAIVTEAHLERPHLELRRGIAHTAGGAVIVEFLEKATREGMAEPRLFPLSLEALRCLGAVEEEGLALICAAALWKMCAQLGFSPQLDECVCCGEPVHDDEACTTSTPAFSLSLAQGGVLCAACAPASLAQEGAAAGESEAAFSHVLVDWIRALINTRFLALEPLANAEHQRLGNELLLCAGTWAQAHLGIRLKSLDFLLQIRL